MSNEQTWQKRQALRLECPSGNVCFVRRPSPEVSLKGGRLVHIFAPGSESTNPIEGLSDEEAAKVYLFARQLVLAAVVTPKLSAEESDDAITPEDIPPSDFWFVFKWAMRGGPGLPVALKEGETTIEAVETFPEGQAAMHISGSDSEQVSRTQIPV